LYDLLKERDEATNISHKALPGYEIHCAFVDSQPYAAWYFIEINGHTAGACYLSKQDEIGVFIFKALQGFGYGGRAAKALIDGCGRRRYLANINPHNERSAELFSRMGFKLIQHTYELTL
jgi:RimJ/RimL family protein N-acetyltransferase